MEEKQKEVAEARHVLDLHRKVRAARRDPNWRDWAGGLPEELLAKIARSHVAQTEAGWAAYLKGVLGMSEEKVQERMTQREREGNCLFVVALVCKPWRKAQLNVGGPLRTRVMSDVLLPGRMALVKWALAVGCPSETYGMARFAADVGHMELLQWLCKEQGFEIDANMMAIAVGRGNLELMQWMRAEGYSIHQDASESELCSAAAEDGRLEILKWLRAEGCEWDFQTCTNALDFAIKNGGSLETLRWARENGCEWDEETRDGAAELGYTDDFGNLIEFDFDDEEAFEDEYGYSDDE